MSPRSRSRGATPERAPEIARALAACRSHFAFVALFSVMVNLTVLAYPVYMMQVYDRVIGSRSVDTLVVLSTGFALAVVFQAIFTWLRNALLARASARVDRLLAGRVCAALLERSGTRRGETGAQILRDLDAVRFDLCGRGFQTKADLPWSGLYLAVLYSVDWVIGTVAAVSMVVLASLVIANYLLTRGTLAEANRTASDSHRFIEANLRSAEAVLPMGILPGVLARWRTIRDQAIAAQLKSAGRGGLVAAAMAAGEMVAQGAILGSGVLRIIEANVPMVVAFMGTILFRYAMQPIDALVRGWETHQRAEQSLHRLNLLLAEVPARAAGMVLPKPAGRVTFSGVTYGIPGSARTILRNINVEIAAGTTHGIVGPSGSGKSTLVRLLIGNLSATFGHVRVDGADLVNWDRNALGCHIGYLPQEVCLLAGTAADNIGRFGQFDETAIIAAARQSGAHDIIVRLPLGYDTPVGEGGHPISGGQRQMIGLARAVIGAPSLVVLDEPNSNLDGPGETRLMACVAALRDQGTTVVMVSHRPNLLRNLDNLSHLRDGTLVASGPTAAIMQRMRPSQQVSVIPGGQIDLSSGAAP